MTVTVVIPALNEEGNVGRLIHETFRVLPRDILSEMIVIDDGSSDRTGDEIKSLISDLSQAPLHPPQHPNGPERRNQDRRSRSSKPDHCDDGRRRAKRPSRYS